MVAEGRVSRLQAAYSSCEELQPWGGEALLLTDAGAGRGKPLQRVARSLRLVK